MSVGCGGGGGGGGVLIHTGENRLLMRNVHRFIVQQPEDI